MSLRFCGCTHGTFFTAPFGDCFPIVEQERNGSRPVSGPALSVTEITTLRKFEFVEGGFNDFIVSIRHRAIVISSHRVSDV